MMKKTKLLFGCLFVLCCCLSVVSAQQQIALCTDANCTEGADVQLQGPAAVDSDLGFAMTMGYLNADAFEDLVVGMPGDSSVAIFFGKLGTPRVAGDSIVQAINEADIIIQGDVDSQFGFSVAVGQANANGTNPLLIGAPSWDDVAGTMPGAAYLIDSGEWGTLGTRAVASMDHFQIAGRSANGLFGYSVTFGDFFVAGEDAYAVGAPENDGIGAGYVALFSTTNPPGANAIVLPDQGFQRFIYDGLLVPNLNLVDEGLSVGEILVGVDLDGNDIDELAIGAVGVNGGSLPGRVYVRSPLADDGLAVDPVPLNEVDCYDGESAVDYFGFTLAAGNLEGGAAEELVVGAIYADIPGATNIGAIYVFAPGSLAAIGDCGSAAMADHRVVGHRGWDELGHGLAVGNFAGGAGSNDDLAFSARWRDGDQTVVNEIDEGAAYVINGGGGFGSWPTDVSCPTEACTGA
jgi:hypothetical protein